MDIGLVLSNYQQNTLMQQKHVECLKNSGKYVHVFDIKILLVSIAQNSNNIANFVSQFKQVSAS